MDVNKKNQKFRVFFCVLSLYFGVLIRAHSVLFVQLIQVLDFFLAKYFVLLLFSFKCVCKLNENLSVSYYIYSSVFYIRKLM